MKHALFVDCCIRGSESRTAKLAEAFLAALPEEYTVTHLNLMQEGLQPLTGDFFQGRQQLLTAGDRTHPRFRYNISVDLFFRRSFHGRQSNRPFRRLQRRIPAFPLPFRAG